jgi:hypothetical protein
MVGAGKLTAPDSPVIVAVTVALQAICGGGSVTGSGPLGPLLCPHALEHRISSAAVRDLRKSFRRMPRER